MWKRWDRGWIVIAVGAVTCFFVSMFWIVGNKENGFPDVPPSRERNVAMVGGVLQVRLETGEIAGVGERVVGEARERGMVGEAVRRGVEVIRSYQSRDLELVKRVHGAVGGKMEWLDGEDGAERWKRSTQAFEGAVLDWGRMEVYRRGRFVDGLDGPLPQLEFEGRGKFGFLLQRVFPPLREEAGMSGVPPRVEEIVVVLVPGRFMSKPGWVRPRPDGVIPAEMTPAEPSLVAAVYVLEMYRLVGSEEWRLSAWGFDGGPGGVFAVVPTSR